MYTYKKVTTTFHFKSGLIPLALPTSFPSTLELFLACSFVPLSSLLDCQSAVCLTGSVRPPRRGLPRPNCHSQGLTSYTLLPRLPSAAAESAQPCGKPESLRLLNM